LVVEGILRGKGNYKVAGRIVGESDIEGALLLDERGSWLGKIVADVVVIAGRVEGDIIARKQLELQASAVVHGNLEAPVIAIDKGAEHEGNLKMTSGKDVTQYTERRS
jgi:cytoskeletal protein CcmA (bactofilin family)